MQKYKARVLKLGKVAAYLAVSSVITFLITTIQDDPEFFGAITPFINLLLVQLRDMFKKEDVDIEV